VQQTCWTATDRVWCEKLATAWSVTASVVHYLYFTVTAIGTWGYMPVWISGVLAIFVFGQNAPVLLFLFIFQPKEMPFLAHL